MARLTLLCLVLEEGKPPMVLHVGSSTAWTSGTYRVSFHYTRQTDPDTSWGGINIVSGEFTIPT
jgi:hypothetical protein